MHPIPLDLSQTSLNPITKIDVEQSKIIKDEKSYKDFLDHMVSNPVPTLEMISARRPPDSPPQMFKNTWPSVGSLSNPHSIGAPSNFESSPTISSTHPFLQNNLYPQLGQRNEERLGVEPRGEKLDSCLGPPLQPDSSQLMS